MKNPSPKTRDKIYAVVAAAVVVATVFGIIEADEADPEVITDTIVKVIAFVSLLLAKANVKI